MTATTDLIEGGQPRLGRPPKVCAQTCLYCDMHLATQHEHDHMPVPRRNGGQSTFCVCVNCHALKDRTPIGQWPAQMMGELMADWPNLRPSTRIFLAKMCALFTDALAS